MLLIYGFIRGVAYALRKLAEMRHKRVQYTYERHEENFTQLDGDRKLEEVGSGQPVGYALQYKLLKSYEAKEKARQKWVIAANRLTNREGQAVQRSEAALQLRPARHGRRHEGTRRAQLVRADGSHRLVQDGNVVSW